MATQTKSYLNLSENATYDDVVDIATEKVLDQADVIYWEWDWELQGAVNGALDNVIDDSWPEAQAIGPDGLTREQYRDDLLETARIMEDLARATHVPNPYGDTQPHLPMF